MEEAELLTDGAVAAVEVLDVFLCLGGSVGEGQVDDVADVAAVARACVGAPLGLVGHDSGSKGDCVIGV